MSGKRFKSGAVCGVFPTVTQLRKALVAHWGFPNVKRIGATPDVQS